MNSLPKTVTRQRRGCDLNPGPSAPESSTLTTRLSIVKRWATNSQCRGASNSSEQNELGPTQRTAWVCPTDPAYRLGGSDPAYRLGGSSPAYCLGVSDPAYRLGGSDRAHRLSSLPSMRSCVWLADVLAENVMNSGMKSFGMLLVNLSAIASVLPVPVGPTHNT